MLKAAVSAVFFHGFGKEANFFKLVAGYIARRSFDKGRQTVYNGGAGMLNGGGLYNMIFHIGFAGKPPVAHIAVIGSVNLADGLFFNGDSLFGFNGNDGGHTDAAAGFDGGAEGFAVNIVVNNIRNMLLVNGFNGEAEFVADGFAGVPCIGRLELFRMSNFCFKFLCGKVAAVSVCKSKSVFVYVVAVCAFDFLKAVAARCCKSDHVNPENILHTGTGDGAVMFFCNGVKTLYLLFCGGAGINCFFAGGDYVDSAGYAFFNMRINVADEAEQSYNGDVSFAFVKNLICVAGDDNAGFKAKLCKIAHIHTYYCGVDINCADNLCAVVIEVSQYVF